MSVRIDPIAGVNPAVTFSSTHKHMTVRTDGDKNNCFYQDYTAYGYNEQDAFNRFRDCCLRRQVSKAVYNSNDTFGECYECEICPCGDDIATGKRTTLPDNVPWKMWPGY